MIAGVLVPLLLLLLVVLLCCLCCGGAPADGKDRYFFSVLFIFFFIIIVYLGQKLYKELSKKAGPLICCRVSVAEGGLSVRMKYHVYSVLANIGAALPCISDWSSGLPRVTGQYFIRI